MSKRVVIITLAIVVGCGKAEPKKEPLAHTVSAVDSHVSDQTRPEAVIHDMPTSGAKAEPMPEKEVATDPESEEADVSQPLPELNDQETLTSIGSPDLNLLDHLENGTFRDLKSRLSLVRRGRLAALRETVAATQTMYAAGISEVTKNVVLQSHTELTQAEMEYSNTETSRVKAIKSLVAVCISMENEVRAKHEAGAIGSWELYTAVAARLRAEERLLRELLTQQQADGATEEAAQPKLSIELFKDDVAKETLDSVGPPDEKLLESIEHSPQQEIKARLTLVQSGRIAALLLRVKAIQACYDEAIYGITMASVMEAQADLTQAELESTNNPAMRLAALRSMVATAARMENEVQMKSQVGADGGNAREVYSAIAARLRAEELLTREILDQQAAEEPGEQAVEMGKIRSQVLRESLHWMDADKILNDIVRLGEELRKNLELAIIKEVEARHAFVQQGRIAALWFRVEAIQAEYEAMVGVATFTKLMLARADLAHAVLESDNTPGSRRTTLKSLVVATSTMENEVRLKHEARAYGGSSRELYAAMAVRLRAEELWLREILAQQQQPKH